MLHPFVNSHIRAAFGLLERVHMNTRCYNLNRAVGAHAYCAGRPGGVSGYPRVWYRSVS